MTDTAGRNTEPVPLVRLALKSSQFRRSREADWRALETLVTQAEKRGIASLDAEAMARLPLLYRTTLSSLSVARSIALDRNLLIYLEALSIRAFLVVYSPRVRPLRAAYDFLARGFPRAVRAAATHFGIAAATLVAGIIAGFMLTHASESWFAALVPQGLAEGRGPDSTREELLKEEIFAPWPGAAESFGLMANFLFSHNTLIGILTFGLGIAAGVPTIILIFYQGLTVGAFIALHEARGLLTEILGWLSIHGVTELTALTLFGAGGLVIAEKILFPGRQSRIENLASHGRVAGQIAIGAILMLFVAAILEGGFRQLVQSTELRLVIGGTTALVWLAYFTLAGRTR